MHKRSSIRYRSTLGVQAQASSLLYCIWLFFHTYCQTPIAELSHTTHKISSIRYRSALGAHCSSLKSSISWHTVYNCSSILTVKRLSLSLHIPRTKYHRLDIVLPSVLKYSIYDCSSILTAERAKVDMLLVRQSQEYEEKNAVYIQKVRSLILST